MNIKWDSNNYKEQFSFVPQYGEDVMGLITKRAGSTAIDLGCGNGTLTKKLADKGFQVTGIDASEEMLSLARAEYPELHFFRGDALTFALETKADLIFSNAVFHWIDGHNQERLIENLSRQLADDGELVCEFGGYGCAETVHSTLERCFEERNLKYPRTFYFPTIGTYAPMLEKHGLRVEYATLFDRPTVQKSDNGLREWIEMFVKTPFENMDADEKNSILAEAEQALREVLFRDGKWYIDYVRIRLRARKQGQYFISACRNKGTGVDQKTGV